MESKSKNNSYISLLTALIISYVVMLVLMLSRVNEFGNFFISLNQVYMSGLMVSTMLLLAAASNGFHVQE